MNNDLNQYKKRLEKLSLLIEKIGSKPVFVTQTTRRYLIDGNNVFGEKSADIFIGAKTLNNMTTLTSEQIKEVSSDPNEKYRMQLLQ